MTEANEGIFGIDLGTTYSVMSYIDDSGKPVIIRDITEGSETVPSVVYFQSDSNVIVGQLAKDSAIVTPDLVISMIKRQMGKPEWRRTINGKEYNPASVSAFILRALANNAKADTDLDVTKVVVTVPAYFGMLEKQATRQAGEIAGLEVVEVVPEPVAAAYAYGMASEAAEKTILVYDLGGGTFDVSLIELTPDSVQVVVANGNHELGGRDWDAVLVDFLGEQTVAQLGDESLLDDPHFVQNLWKEAETLKKRLSRTESRPFIYQASGGTAEVTVTRAQFEEMTASLVAQTVDITRKALAEAEEKSPGITGNITDVILVGGSSLMPIIPVTLKKEFGWDAKLTDPHLAVAKGAALVAAGAVARDFIEEKTRESREASGELPSDVGSGDVAPIEPTQAEKDRALAALADATGVGQADLERYASIVHSGVLPKAVGVKLVDSRIPDWREQLKQPNSDDPRSGPFRVAHLVSPQENLPYKREEVFKAQTITAGQDRIEIELWEQAGGSPGEAMHENNPLPVEQDIAYIGDLAQYQLPEGSEIDIYFDISAEGIVTLRAVEPKSGRDLKVTATIALLTPDEMAESKEILRGMTTGT